MRRAVAVKYDSTRSAPFVLARGTRALADRIVALAAAHGVEIVADQDLTESLFLVDVDNEIPEELFEAVAALLAYVYKVRDAT